MLLPQTSQSCLFRFLRIHMLITRPGRRLIFQTSPCSLIWRALFDSHQHWRLRPTYLRALEPIPTPVPSRPPSPASLFSTLSISSHPPPTPRHPDGSLNLLQTPLRRPAYKSRTSTATSVSKIQLFSPTHPSSHLPYIDWKKMYQKRAWLDARWGKEQYGQEKVFEGHEDSVYCLQMDGVKLVTGSRDKTWVQMRLFSRF